MFEPQAPALPGDEYTRAGSPATGMWAVSISRDIIPMDSHWDVWASEGGGGQKGCPRAGKQLRLIAHCGMMSLPSTEGCPGLLHPPCVSDLSCAWASLEAALGFDVTPNLCRLVTITTFLFQSLKWQGFGLQEK